MISRQQLFVETDAPDDATWPTWHTAAWLTVPDDLRRSELQVLVHGAGYDHRYWDWPVEAETYSYVEWAAARGVTTLNIDRVGCGASSRPPGMETTTGAQADALSQLVVQARAGLPGAPPFERVVLLGHSMGSAVVGYEAAVHGDVDAVVLTGYLPVGDEGAPAPDQSVFIDTNFLRANEAIPSLRGIVDDDYVVAKPEGREPLMYRTGKADPDLIAMDEEMKGTATRGELMSAGEAGPVIRRGTVPTLGLVGQFDVLLMRRGGDCYDRVEEVRAQSPAHFDYAVVPDGAHNLNLHPDAHEAYEIIDRWLTARARRAERASSD